MTHIKTETLRQSGSFIHRRHTYWVYVLICNCITIRMCMLLRSPDQLSPLQFFLLVHLFPQSLVFNCLYLRWWCCERLKGSSHTVSQLLCWISFRVTCNARVFYCLVISCVSLFILRLVLFVSRKGLLYVLSTSQIENTVHISPSIYTLLQYQRSLIRHNCWSLD